MDISSRERNIVLLAGLVAVIFAGNFLFPAIKSAYQQRQENIEDLLLDNAREIRLIEDSARWRERRLQVDAQQAAFDSQIFSGDTVPLIEAAIQRDLSQYARNTAISVNSTRLAERLQTGDWLLISQEMSFRTGDAANTIEFLQLLETSTPRLHVSDFSLSRSRQQYTGSITVVGFARNQGMALSANSQR